ncbi:CD276 antigen-like [Heterodontus francisci]|uniref:CD276 antigen-like n=1 Tax=Heterodontus francisci TaxID=7792 RepID=UPI00355AEFA3
MKLSLYVILFVCLHHVWSDCPPGCIVTELVAGRAILPCTYRVKDNLSLSKIYLYWQLPSKQMVYVFDKGTSQPATQEERFRQRVMVFESELEKGNLSLQISNVSVADENHYICYLFSTEPEMMKIHECRIQLDLAAPFSTPVLSGPDMKDIRAGEAVNLTCHSSSGYPQPVVNWTDGSGNSLPEHSQVETRMDPDPVSRLWNVTSVLRIITATNGTFRCSVHNIRTRQTKTSAVWIPPSDNFTETQTGTPSPSYLIVVYVLVAVVGFCWFVNHRYLLDKTAEYVPG